VSNTPILHILIPDLLQALKLWHQDFGFTPESNNSASLLSRSQRKQVPFSGLDASLFSLLGFPADTELPIAHYRAKKDRLTPVLQEHKGAILCADPVHLKAGASEIIMDTHTFGDLSAEEADSLLAVLNQHFAEDGLQFIKGASNRWYLLLDADDSIRTTPLRDLRGKDIAKHLPQSDHIKLHTIQNEIQMLLHSAELNQQREQAGKLSVNSLWLWGGGSHLKARTRVRSVIGGGIQGEIAATVAECRYLASAIEPEETLSQLPAGGHHLLILDQLTAFALQDDLEGWQQQLNKLETTWLAPAEKLFNRGKLTLLLHDCNGSSFIPEKSNKLKQLWKVITQDKPNLMELVK